MADKTCSVSEAFALLRNSLAGVVLGRVYITVACHGLTREKSAGIARDLVASGFGREVKPADRSVRYETHDGWFSWDTVEEGDDVINLFYRLDDDDQPVNFSIGQVDYEQDLGRNEEIRRETSSEEGFVNQRESIRQGQARPRLETVAGNQLVIKRESVQGDVNNQLKARRRLF